nr:DUF86 domain-containing protein [uncultured Flavobacterium sp.]
MSKRNSDLLIGDIIESGNKILSYTKDLSFDEFVNDSMVVDAVIRNFEIIGEAANRLPIEFKDFHPDIDWHRIRGFRNRIVHDYVGIDYKIVWLVKESFLPDLIARLKSLGS